MIDLKDTLKNARFEVRMNMKLTDEQWYDLAQRHVNSDWNSTGYLDAIKAVCADFALLSASKPAAPAQSAEPVAWAAGSGLVAPIVRDQGSAQRLSDEHGDGTVIPLYTAPQPSPTAVVLDDERAALPEEVREALTHAAGGWRGAARGTRDDAEGEHRSADYNRRAQVIESWLARAASPQPVEPTWALTPSDADMVWCDDDDDGYFRTIDQAVAREVAYVRPVDDEIDLKLQLAKRIPTATIRIFNITERGYEWEIVTADGGAT